MNGLYDGEFAGFKIASSDDIDAALRKAVVAIDANVLLDLYRFRPQTSRDLIKTLKGLGDRLVVPHQALREFWRHRQRSQGSPRGATKAATDALAKSGRSMRDALATWAKAVGVDDDELSDLTARVDDFVEALKDELQHVLQDADAERGGDPILEQLEELLAGRVTSPLPHEEWTECVAEANRRIEAEEPPGFRDADKQVNDSPEGGAGDYLVWYQAT
ncbi:PIN-like domain-containing protein, partial [Micromonospora sp. MS34]|uniref:PIN-like domain-containing protein n=1 Tax=Micromonospora sp. MS34 TaxID=3385971 RepID=UPI00399F7A5F